LEPKVAWTYWEYKWEMMISEILFVLVGFNGVVFRHLRDLMVILKGLIGLNGDFKNLNGS